MDDPRAELAARADPADALVLARYFQVRPGGYGEGDTFLGVKLSEVRRVARPHLGAPYDPERWLPLLRSPIHEHRQLALVVLGERASRSRRRSGHPAEGERIAADYLAHTAYVDNWDLVDLSAGPIVGGWLLDRERTVLDVLAGSDSVWERRIAIVATHTFLRHGQSADTYRIAVRLLADHHDLIHKAVGWSLREAGKRVDRNELRRFLDRYAATMPRTALRYALERFDRDERTAYLAR